MDQRAEASYGSSEETSQSKQNIASNMPKALDNLDIQRKGRNGLQPIVRLVDCVKFGPELDEKKSSPVYKSLYETFASAEVPLLTCSKQPDNITAFPSVAYEYQQGLIGAAGMFAVVEKGVYSGLIGKIHQHDENICLLTVIRHKEECKGLVRVDIDYVRVAKTYEDLFKESGHETGPKNSQMS